MPVELLLLLLAWAATVALIVVVPWAVVRFTVRALETDVSKPGAGHERAQPHYPPDAAVGATPSHRSDDASESDDGVLTVTPEEDVDG